MIEFYLPFLMPNNFTGKCKITHPNVIRYYKNGLIHRENGAAEYSSGHKLWYYKNKCYGANNDFTKNSWKEKVKELKYLESLEIFK